VTWQTHSGKLLSHYCRRRRKQDLRCGLARQILNGIFYQLKNGCNWGDLPNDLPPSSTVLWHYKQCVKMVSWLERDGVIWTSTRTSQKKTTVDDSNHDWLTHGWKILVMPVLSRKGFVFTKWPMGLRDINRGGYIGFPFLYSLYQS